MNPNYIMYRISYSPNCYTNNFIIKLCKYACCEYMICQAEKPVHRFYTNIICLMLFMFCTMLHDPCIAFVETCKIFSSKQIDHYIIFYCKVGFTATSSVVCLVLCIIFWLAVVVIMMVSCTIIPRELGWPQLLDTIQHTT